MVKRLAELSLREVNALDPETRARWERDVGEPIMARIRARMEPLAARWTADLAQWESLPEDSDPGDLFKFDVAALVFFGTNDELRMRAARRIARQLDLRLHAGRGVHIPAGERRELVLAALFEVLEDGTPGQGGEDSVSWGFTPAEIERNPGAVLRLLEGAVRERLTQDARGPAWRDAQRDDPWDDDALALVAAVEGEAEAVGELPALIVRADLSPTQRRVVEALLAADPAEPQKAIAKQLGMAPGTFRAQLDRARKKIRAAV
jgi:hypothetical protein